MNRLYRSAMVLAAAGLLLLLAVMGSGVAYPHPFFTVGTLVGLVCIFVSLPLFFVGWIQQLHQSMAAKQYGWAVCIALFGVFVVVRALIRLL